MKGLARGICAGVVTTAISALSAFGFAFSVNLLALGITAHAATITVDDATFVEQANAPFGDFSEFGTDPALAENVSSSGSFTIDPVTFTWTSRSRADSLGPLAFASMDLSSAISGPGLLSANAIAATLIEYSLAVYNKDGTAIPLTVPVRFTGFYAINHSASGSIRLWSSGVSLFAFLQPGGFGTGLVSEVRSHLDSSGPVTAGFNEVLPVMVDAAPLSVTRYNIRLIANARAWVEASQTHGGEVSLGQAQISAIIDPEIFIDPTWEHADKFGIVLSSNIEPFSAPIPLPASLWLLASAVGGLVARRALHRS